MYKYNMSEDIRTYINLIREAIAPGHFTTQRDDIGQQSLFHKALEIEKTIDNFIEDGTYQGKKKQMADYNGKTMDGSYIVDLPIQFSFKELSSQPNLIRVRMANNKTFFDVVSPVEKNDVKKLLDIIALKYQKAGWRAESHFGGGEKGWLFLSHNISGTPQG
jgi:hypothetical protein